MTTTDPDALTERIAMAWNESTPEQWAEIDRHRGGPGLKALVLQDAARILPIIAVEVRKAKAEAWDEGHNTRRTVERGGWYLNPYRETGDSDEHR